MKTPDLFDLHGKVAVVTGGYTGLGNQMAEALLEAGADVAVCARKTERWEKSFKELQAKATAGKRKLLGVRCDVSVENDVKRLISETENNLGPVDILVNNAGIAWKAPPEEMKIEDWQKVMDVNLTGAFICSQIAGRLMIKRRQGVIINVSSVTGLYGVDSEVLDTIGYTSSKAGLIGFTRDLAVKWAKHGIRVNAILPGWFKTHLTEHVVQRSGEEIARRVPLRRLGGEYDLKGAVVYLASKASEYVTGQILIVDGGLTSTV